MRSIIILLILIINPVFTYAQCEQNNRAFKVGELVEYDVTYNWGFMWVTAGDVYFSVRDTLVGDKSYFHFRGYGKSVPRWDWMFKVRDQFDAIADKETLQPILFDRNTNEGGYAVREIYQYNYDKQYISSDITTSKKPQKIRNIPIEGCVYDVLTMIYIARNIDFSGKKEGEKIPVNLVLDGDIHPVFMRYRGIEKIKTREGTTYDCIKFTTMLIEGSMFSEGEDMTVWVTNDANKIPVLVEAKILVGSVKASLRSTKGLRH